MWFTYKYKLELEWMEMKNLWRNIKNNKTGLFVVGIEWHDVSAIECKYCDSNFHKFLQKNLTIDELPPSQKCIQINKNESSENQQSRHITCCTL